MIKKYIYDLTCNDLNQFPVWYFPMDDTVEDETVIVPFVNLNLIKKDYQVIVKTIFIDYNNKEYVGYIYWGSPYNVDCLMPILFLNNLCVTFWNGMGKPEKEYINKIKKELGKGAFPINYESNEIMGLKQIKGSLEGLYYLNSANNIKHVKI